MKDFDPVATQGTCAYFAYSNHTPQKFKSRYVEIFNSENDKEGGLSERHGNQYASSTNSLKEYKKRFNEIRSDSGSIDSYFF